MQRAPCCEGVREDVFGDDECAGVDGYLLRQSSLGVRVQMK